MQQGSEATNRLQADLMAVLAKHQAKPVDYDTKLKSYFKSDFERLEEIKEELETLGENIKETLSYSDMNLTSVENELSEYHDLKEEKDRIYRNIRRVEAFIEHLQKPDLNSDLESDNE